ncbi:MAG TPA: hypothetical protein VH867_03580 [Burkholderiales bacterium]|jgi:hypothetical protein
MTKRRRANGNARPIRTKRDYERVSAIARQLSGRDDRDSAAELRLQSLLRELDQFDDSEEDTDPGLPDDGDYMGPRRRWSDDGSDD